METNRYLLFGGPGIGDTMIELIAAKSIKRSDPNSAVDLIFSSSTGADKIVSEILKYQDYIEQYYCYNKNRKWSTIKTFIHLRKKRYKYSFSCSTAFKSTSKPAIISRIIGITSVIKEVKGKTGKIDIPVIIDETLHFAKQYFKLLEEVHLYTPVDGIVISLSKLNFFELKNKGRKIVTICLGTNSTIYYQNDNPICKNIKEWDVKRWNEVAKTLTFQELHVVLIGGKKEAEKYKNTCNNSENSRMEILAGRTTIGQSLSILSQSSLVVGADTGMMHCAAGLGIPTLTLFGGTDYKIWKPFSSESHAIVGKSDCSPCYGKDYAMYCYERKCMKEITVQSVVKKINILLNDSNN